MQHVGLYDGPKIRDALMARRFRALYLGDAVHITMKLRM
jgi:hypothetical protein